MRQFCFHQKRQHRYDVFVKPRAEGKLAFTMPRRENDCCEETNLFFNRYLTNFNTENIMMLYLIRRKMLFIFAKNGLYYPFLSNSFWKQK